MPCAFCSHSTNGSKFAITSEDGVTTGNLIRNVQAFKIKLCQPNSLSGLLGSVLAKTDGCCLYILDQGCGSHELWCIRSMSPFKTAMMATSAMSTAKNRAADGTLTSRTPAKWYHQEQLTPHPASCDTQPGTCHQRPQKGTTGYNRQRTDHTFGRSIHARYMGTTTWAEAMYGNTTSAEVGEPAGYWQH